jgi:hypothetical protein
MKILVGITGGIAAYKTIDVISGLIKRGHEVHVIMSDNSKPFCPQAVVNVVSKGNLKSETPDRTVHIEESKWCDVFLLVPATANTISKIAYGVADSFLLATILALPDKTRIMCPAMNTNMWENPITQENIDRLKKFGWKTISPVEGMLACGDLGMGKLPNSREIIENFEDIVNPSNWTFPLDMNYKGKTIDSYSFLDLNLDNEVEIPVFPHVGAFGVRRRYDHHCGVDLYAPIDTPVYAVEDGEIVDICPFTGPSAGYDFWLDTEAVYVRGESGVVVYGEIEVERNLKIGDKILQKQYLGKVKRVIIKDKGRPTSMLHIELHHKDHTHCGNWHRGSEKPFGKLDPTHLLIKSKKK